MPLPYLMIKIGKKYADCAAAIRILLTELILFSFGMLIKKSFYLWCENPFGNNSLFTVEYKKYRRSVYIITGPEIRCYTVKAIYINPRQLVFPDVLFHFAPGCIHADRINFKIEFIAAFKVEVSEQRAFFFAMAAIGIPEVDYGVVSWNAVQRNRILQGVE